VKLVWTRTASTDRKEIREYIAQVDPVAALAIDELISQKASGLVDHPGLGRPGRVTGTRELVLHQNYILIYDTSADLIRLLRVLHAARQWPPARH
jgi:toxin ParE1/3/4